MLFNIAIRHFIFLLLCFVRITRYFSQRRAPLSLEVINLMSTLRGE